MERSRVYPSRCDQLVRYLPADTAHINPRSVSAARYHHCNLYRGYSNPLDVQHSPCAGRDGLCDGVHPTRSCGSEWCMAEGQNKKIRPSPLPLGRNTKTFMPFGGSCSTFLSVDVEDSHTTTIPHMKRFIVPYWNHSENFFGNGCLFIRSLPLYAIIVLWGVRGLCP
jgi:hypothetical protein